MMETNETQNLIDKIRSLVPEAIAIMGEMLRDPRTPAATKAQLIGMILDRVFGKAETLVTVNTPTEETMEMAELRLQKIIQEVREKYMEKHGT